MLKTIIHDKFHRKRSFLQQHVFSCTVATMHVCVKVVGTGEWDLHDPLSSFIPKRALYDDMYADYMCVSDNDYRWSLEAACEMVHNILNP